MYTISTEMIGYQREDTFPREIDIIVKKMLVDIKNKKYTTNKDLLSKSKDVKDLEKLIKNRLGLLVEVDPVISDMSPLAIIPFERENIVSVGLKDGIFKDLMSGVNNFATIERINNILRERKSASTKSHGKKGYVNNKLAKVGGYLSELKHYLIINVFSLVKMGLTPEEITAGILHELGHAFEGLSYHHRVTTTNATILDIMQDINDNKQDVVIHRYKEFFKDTDIKEREMSTTKDVTNFSTEIAKAYIKKIDSEFINAKYDETTFENLADSFASRFGRAQEIATCLEKMMRYGGQIGHVSTKGFYVLGNIVSLLGWAVLMYHVGGLFSIVGVVIVYMILKLGDTRKMVYDFPLDRINRLRNSVINYLKMVDLSDELTKNLLSQYEVITKILTENFEMNQTMSRIAKDIDVFNLGNVRYLRTQQTIENILNNELFVTSAKIRVI